MHGTASLQFDGSDPCKATLLLGMDVEQPFVVDGDSSSIRVLVPYKGTLP